jgi:hypothetical protein
MDPRLSNGLDKLGLAPGAKVLVRVVDFDLSGERLKLSLQHAAGGRLVAEDVADLGAWLERGRPAEVLEAGREFRQDRPEPARFVQHSQSVERLIAEAKRRPRAG